jgi:hypothetical protein
MSTKSGRTNQCSECKRRAPRCASCDARTEFGEPRPGDAWTTQLWLTRDEFDLLLVAAAEYEEIAEEAQLISSAVTFLDWIQKDCVEPDERAELRAARAKANRLERDREYQRRKREAA